MHRTNNQTKYKISHSDTFWSIFKIIFSENVYGIEEIFLLDRTAFSRKIFQLKWKNDNYTTQFFIINFLDAYINEK